MYFINVFSHYTKVCLPIVCYSLPQATQLPEDGQVSPFQLILARSLLAQHLKQAYDE